MISEQRRKECKKYYEAHREAILEKQKQYYEAHKEERKLYREGRKEEIHEYNVQYNATHKEWWKAYNAQYSATHREKFREAARRHAVNHPRRVKARRALTNAIKQGKIVPPKTCMACNGTDSLEGHHEDYDKPLEVIWLCKECHLGLHRP